MEQELFRLQAELEELKKTVQLLLDEVGNFGNGCGCCEDTIVDRTEHAIKLYRLINQ